MTYHEFYHEAMAAVYVCTIALSKPYFLIVMCWTTAVFMDPEGLP